MSLTHTQVRKLTDVEIVSIISGLLGSLAIWNDVDTIMRALAEVESNKEHYKEYYSKINKLDPAEVIQRMGLDTPDRQTPG